MRDYLEKLYLWSGYVAAAFVGGIALSIVIQIIQRFRGYTFDATEAAGLCMAASTFFGLAHTFRHGSHVRINLLTAKLPARSQRVIELLNCALGLAVVGFVAYHMTLFAIQSHNFNDVTPGLLAMPMWIPQSGVAFGVIILAIALLDEFIWVAQGRSPRVLGQDEVNLEETVA